MRQGYPKVIGNLIIYVGEGPPRHVTISDRRESSSSLMMGIEEARDLHYALGRLITLADNNDTENK